MESLKSALDIVIDLTKKWGPSLLYCLLFIVLGLLVSSILTKYVKKALTKSKKLNDKLISVVLTIIKIIIFTVVVLAVFNKIGIDVTSIITLFSAAGLAFSFAARDTLSNIFKGLQIFFTKPFNIGDYIETNDISGTVKSVGIFYTRLLSDDNKDILIPNREVADEKIVNYSSMPLRILNLEFEVPYYNGKQAKDIVKNALEKNKTALKMPSPTIVFNNCKNEKITISLSVYVNQKKYSVLKEELLESVYGEFIKHNLYGKEKSS